MITPVPMVAKLEPVPAKIMGYPFGVVEYLKAESKLAL